MTKLFLPPPRARMVGRPRLLVELDGGLDRPLTLLSAPAGFGKTTLVSDWAQHLNAKESPPRLFWISLDEADNDPVRFMRYVTAALRPVAPHATEAIFSVVRATPPPPLPALMGILINDLVRLSQECVLVLDDYHVIRDRGIHETVAFLLDHMPPRLHLLIATREDPPLPLARLRGRNALTELRQADLRFTAEEAASFLRDVMELTVSPADVQALEVRTEGWIAGLQMAGLSMQEHADMSAFVAAFSGSNRYVLDYLAEEVLAGQSAPLQDFLLRTSILRQLSAPLCDAMLNVPRDGGNHAGNAQDMLEHLERANVFLVPLDAERRSYRYHHLFADLLRARLRQTRPELLPELHGKASAWYERAGLPADAICHALAGGDAERAAYLITRHGFWLVGRGLARTVLGWLESLPPELAAIHPSVALVHAAALAATGDLGGAEEHLQDAERTLQSDPPTTDARTLQGQVATIRGRVALYLLGDVKRAVALSRKALDLLPPTKRATRGVALSMAGTAYLITGDVGLATERSVAASAQSAVKSRSPGLAPRSMALLARLQVMQGRLRQAASTYARAARLVGDQPDLVGVLSGLAYHFGMGDLLREWNDLDAAEDLLRPGLDALADTAFVMPHDALLGYAALAGVLDARDDVTGAIGTIDAFLDLARRRDFVAPLAAHASAILARIQLRHGGLTDAVRWAEASRLPVDDELPYPWEAGYLTLARVLLAQGRLADATHLLGRLLDVAEAAGRMGSAIEILMLRALGLRAQHETVSALADLSRALTLAEPAGYVRIFVDERQPMAVLLQEAADRGIAAAYTRKLLAVIHGRATGPRESESGSHFAETAPLTEPLTPREREVLHLVAAGASNSEIARRLGVAATTVQTHVHHIFGKLSVRSRTQALAKARALKLL